jgi:hypothetical protein
MSSSNCEAMARAVVAVIQRALLPRDQRIAELTATIDALQAQHATLEKAIEASSRRLYRQNTIVSTDDGTRWTAIADTLTMPGSSSAWRPVEDGRVR